MPTDIPIWTWLFNSPHSPLAQNHRSFGRYENALTKESLDWAQVKEASTNISTSLVRNHGLRQGETVALFSQNSVWYPVAMFAALRAGAKVSGASPAYNVEEMTYALKTADAKFLMTAPSSLDVAVQAAKNAGIPKERVMLLEGGVAGYTTMKSLIEMGKLEREQTDEFVLPEGKKNGDVCAFLSFSSGTTGLPK